MSATGDRKLSTAEELVELNKRFAQRYTDEDEEYIQMGKPRFKSPPIVDDWGPDKNNYRNQRHNNNNRYDHQQYRNHSHDNRYRRDRSRSPPYYYDKRR